MNPKLDPFLDDALDDLRDADILAALVDSLEPIAPSAAARAALLAATQAPGRLHRFADKVASMLDVTVEKAKALLDRVADAVLWERDLFPGMDALWVDGGPGAANCIRGFARLRAGEAFPEHDHLGVETQLVLEGAMLVSDGRVVRPGEVIRSEPGTSHSYRAAPGGPDLLFFVVVAEGITLPDGDLRHRDALDA